MNYPKTVGELLKWGRTTGKDTFGTYTVITGFEGTGGCFWCGKELSGRRRFCGNRSGHWTAYQDYFYWAYAKFECIKRAGNHCESCGAEEGVWGYYNMSTLEVHHIIPLDGQDRAMSVFNVPWNLVCLCHTCHMELHAVMRLPKDLLYTPTLFEIRKGVHYEFQEQVFSQENIQRVVR
jgi:hypothetical protein